MGSILKKYRAAGKVTNVVCDHVAKLARESATIGELCEAGDDLAHKILGDKNADINYKGKCVCKIY